MKEYPFLKQHRRQARLFVENEGGKLDFCDHQRAILKLRSRTISRKKKKKEGIPLEMGREPAARKSWGEEDRLNLVVPEQIAV